VTAVLGGSARRLVGFRELRQHDHGVGPECRARCV